MHRQAGLDSAQPRRWPLYIQPETVYVGWKAATRGDVGSPVELRFEAEEAGRLPGYLAAYVLLSPGSLSDSSIRSIDESGVPWLLISAREDRFLVDVSAAVRAGSRTVEIHTVPGSSHATDMLADHARLSERIATWLAARLR